MQHLSFLSSAYLHMTALFFILLVEESLKHVSDSCFTMCFVKSSDFCNSFKTCFISNCVVKVDTDFMDYAFLIKFHCFRYDNEVIGKQDYGIYVCGMLHECSQAPMSDTKITALRKIGVSNSMQF